MLIQSAANPRFKQLKKLRDKKEREKTGSFLLEGLREMQRAQKCGYRFLTLIFAKPLLTDEARDFLTSATEMKVETLELSPQLFNQLVVREDLEGILAVAQIKSHDLQILADKITSVKSPLLLAIENSEKPGNLGAILRSADAAAVDGVVIVGAGDIYNPNMIRSSLGAAFSCVIAQCDGKQLLEFCKQKKIRIIVAAQKPQSISFWQENYQGPTLIMLGNEATGVTPMWWDQTCVHIPMDGVCDSLNVSVAGALLLYEAKRQRMASS